MKIKLAISVIVLSFFFCLILTSKDTPKDYGIGPIKPPLNLPPVDLKLAKWGKTLFDQKCVVCHTLDAKKTGPPLRFIARDETPEFIMNLLLNTTEMQQKDEHIKQLIKQYNNVLMIDYKLSKNDAHAILEYLRAAAAKQL